MDLLSKHAERRCKSRGISRVLLTAILDNADIDADAGGGCRVFRVRHKTATGLGIGDRLHRFAVIWSERSNRIVTVLPLHAGRSGRHYRKIR